MRAYIINLDTAEDRWSFVKKSFAGTQFTLCRVSAVNGIDAQFPIADYSESRYRWFHGRPTSPACVGCYFSHIKAIKAFLATDDAYALIGEDDITLRPDLEAVLTAALRHSKYWNILRLSGLSPGLPARVTKLFGDYSLCVGLGRLKGTGAYVIDREAGQALATKLLPMWLPIDHAMDREWRFGLRAAYVFPFPASQRESDFLSSIHRGESVKLSAFRRYLTTYPYQATNEVTRWLFRVPHFLTARLSTMLKMRRS